MADAQPKAKKPAAHPPFKNLVIAAIAELKEVGSRGPGAHNNAPPWRPGGMGGRSLTCRESLGHSLEAGWAALAGPRHKVC
jgi:hypothetical protein